MVAMSGIIPSSYLRGASEVVSVCIGVQVGDRVINPTRHDEPRIAALLDRAEPGTSKPVQVISSAANFRPYNPGSICNHPALPGVLEVHSGFVTLEGAGNNNVVPVLSAWQVLPHQLHVLIVAIYAIDYGKDNNVVVHDAIMAHRKSSGHSTGTDMRIYGRIPFDVKEWTGELQGGKPVAPLVSEQIPAFFGSAVFYPGWAITRQVIEIDFASRKVVSAQQYDSEMALEMLRSSQAGE